jgi:hypothetical protein
MKWFKHHADMSRDENVARMMDESGRDQLAVYGLFNIVLERIAEKMEARRPNDCSVTYSPARWARLLGTNKQRAKGLMKKLSTNRALTVEVTDDTCTVTVPQMLDLADEYFRKCRQAPDKVAQKREEQNRLEKRENKDKGALSGCLAAGGARLSPPPDFKITDSLQEWAAKNHPIVDIHKETESFKNYEHPKSYSDWNVRWKTWIRRAAEYQEKNNSSSGQPSLREGLLKLGKDMCIERLNNESEADYCDRINELNRQRIREQQL